jgi:hypothetical protein
MPTPATQDNYHSDKSCLLTKKQIINTLRES